MPANRYGTAITRQQVDANTLQIDEDITFNNVRVGGVRVVFDFLAPDAQKLSAFTIVSSVADQTHLQQIVELTYNGVAFTRLTVSAAPQPGDVEAPQSISIETQGFATAGQIPIAFACSILP